MMQLPKMPSFSLNGKTALVVGASSGIGIACAVALAEHGAKVFLAARRKVRLKELADCMIKKNYQVQIIELDASTVPASQEHALMCGAPKKWFPIPLKLQEDLNLHTKYGKLGIKHANLIQRLDFAPQNPPKGG